MLEARGLNAFYGDVRVLWDVSLEVREGQIVTIVGANGAGKTTALRALAGLVRANGSVRMWGQEMSGRLAHERVAAGLVMVPEGRRLFPFLTVRENLEMGCYLPKARRQKNESMERVLSLFPRVRERLSQLAGTLSGGEQQMVAIARGLMAQPRVLIMDEPTLGLAPMLTDSVFQTITELNRRGITILLVEQNARRALEIAHHGYVLENGRVTLSGPPGELLNDERLRNAYLGL